MGMSVGQDSGDEDVPMSDINTTPLVDVMLVLLIIFLIAVPVVLQSVPVQLPTVAYEVTQTKPENVNLSVSGLPGPDSGKVLLRELKSLRGVLDAQPAGDNAFRLELPEGGASDLIAEYVLKPLNAKLGQACFALGGVSGQSVNVTFAAACAQETVRGKLETTPPAGLLAAPPARGKAVLKV